jgi:uncharacterized membrane protein
MTTLEEHALRCCVCGRACGDEDPTPLDMLPDNLRDVLRVQGADSAESVVCRACLVDGRLREITARLAAERGELTALERDVARKVAEGSAVARHLDEEFMRGATRPQRLADDVARVGGSWRFVLLAVLAIALWMALNSALLRGQAFDPYPYILLNLVLPCLAALQAPIIMMSQNRAAQRDRVQANQDFEVNLKAELEVAALHAKIDHLMQVRWEDLLTIQELQLELLRGIERRNAHPERSPRS